MRHSDAKRVSVVIAAFNAAGFLAETLQSIIDQSAPPGEIIVVDDGSTDGTADLARSFPGVMVITVKNGGPAAARNIGIEAASGEFIALMDADDKWPADKLAVQLEALESYGRPAFSFTDYRIFDEQGFYKREAELRGEAAFRKAARRTRDPVQYIVERRGKQPVMRDISFILPSTAMIRRSDLLAVGGHNEALRFGEDYELFLRLFAIMPAVVVMKPLMHYRRHPGQGTQKTAVKMKAAHFEVARLVAASPERYPPGDVRYIARTNYLRQYRMGILHARLGNLDETVRHLELSLAARRTVSATVVLAGARLCLSAPGRRLLSTAQSLWRRRPGRR